MIPTNVGGSPRKKPDGPGPEFQMSRVISAKLFVLEDDDDAWSCVLMTSNGLFSILETVPAMPPERRLMVSINGI